MVGKVLTRNQQFGYLIKLMLIYAFEFVWDAAIPPSDIQAGGDKPYIGAEFPTLEF